MGVSIGSPPYLLSNNLPQRDGQTSDQRPALLFLYSVQHTRVDRHFKFYWGRQSFLLVKPFLGGRMRFVATETGQVMSPHQTPTTTGHYFRK